MKLVLDGLGLSGDRVFRITPDRLLGGPLAPSTRTLFISSRTPSVCWEMESRRPCLKAEGSDTYIRWGP